ncbi:hypothetical protein [Salinadaptatus halalkaliphilus]|uniref:hypothetical protein n=1 Tax=Salinadaptatus halalkaliphilus TaxID=2419781 RepID=UPI0011412DA6|nr:hypothetical protein [Salinadaptatus halalkaliphilus]
MSAGLEHLGWLVPTSEWEPFKEWVRDVTGGYKGSLGRYVEKAIEDYIRFADAVKKLQTLADDVITEEETDIPHSLVGDDLTTDSKTEVRVRIAPYSKDGFRNAVSESKNSYGVELARALRQYRTNPFHEWVADLADRLSTALDDTEDEPPEDTINDQDGVNKQPRTVEEKTEAIVDYLETEMSCESHQISRDDLDEAIEVVVGDGEPTKRTMRKYRNQVVETLNLGRHPQTPKLYKPVAELPDRPDDYPWECWVSVEYLKGDPEARARRVVLELGKQAAASNGRIGIEKSAVCKEILNEAVSPATARRTVAAVVDNYPVKTKRENLRLNLVRLAEEQPELAEEIVAYANFDPDSSAAVTDCDSSPDNWVDRAADHISKLCETSDFDIETIPKQILDNKIARAKYPNEVSDEKSQISEDALERVCEADRDAVSAALAVSDSSPGPTAEEDLQRAAETELEKLSSDTYTTSSTP